MIAIVLKTYERAHKALKDKKKGRKRVKTLQYP